MRLAGLHKFQIKHSSMLESIYSGKNITEDEAEQEKGEPGGSSDTQLARARKAAGMTQQEVADELGVGKPTVSCWEKEAREARSKGGSEPKGRNPNRDHLSSIAKLLGNRAALGVLKGN